jgi:hypothetical protein
MAFQDRFVSRYLNPLEVEAQLSELVGRFPQLCRVEELPFLSHGYQGARVEARGRHKVKALHVTAPGMAATKPAVLLMRSTHAREWINPLAVLETASQLTANYRPEDPDQRVQEIVRILDRVEFVLIPETNPDGALLSFFDEGRRLWRKNLRPPVNGGGCAGVDCNRNFPSFFGQAGSSALPCAETFHGPGPLSEPEAANIAHLVARQRNIIFAIESHSFGQALFRPHSPQGVSAADDAVYRRLEGAMNERIRSVQGVTYATGTTNNFAGTSDDFLYLEHRVFGFALECGEDFQPPVPQALAAALEVAEAAKALGLCAAGEVSGVDVEALLQQRPPAPADDAAAETVTPLGGGTPWVVEPLPPERRSRFLVELAQPRAADARKEYERLVAEGFDARYSERRGVEIVASATTLTDLLRRGYQVVVTRDLLPDEDWADAGRP